MKVLVTGGAGYIGSHTCKYLASAGHVPIVFDDLSQGHEWAVKWGPLERGSLNDPARARRCSGAPSGRRCRPLRRQRAGRRVDDESRQVLPQQHARHLQPARGDARRRRRHHRVLVDVRHLRRPRARADRRDAPAGAGEPVRRVEADGREDAALVRRGATACAGSRCATSTRPAPTRTARSAKTTTPSPTSSRSSSVARSARGRP